MTEESGATNGAGRDATSLALARFLEHNAGSTYDPTGKPGAIRSPWGDPTIQIDIPDTGAESLIEALNSLHLPPLFTALWHLDSHEFEIIFTVMPPDDDLASRSFDFVFKEKTYRAEFGAASERLLLIAEHFQPVQRPSRTSYRNLAVFSGYVGAKKIGAATDTWGSPTSFWIRGIETWDESAAADLVRHMNFFMSYFDLHSPLIVVHQKRTAAVVPPGSVRFLHGQFPASVPGRPLDPYLMIIWESASQTADPLLRFLYNYQILEYAAFYYLETAKEQALRRVLMAPETQAKPNEAVQRVVEILAETRFDDRDPTRFNGAIQQIVDPAMLWKSVEPRAGFFSKELEFVGGFKLPPLLKNNNLTLDEFRKAWFPEVPTSLRQLRNALVHAKEARLTRGIAPTPENYERVRPWAEVIANVAIQMMLYRDI